MVEKPAPSGNRDVHFAELGFIPPLRFSIRKAFGRWGVVALVNALFLGILLAWIRSPQEVIEGGSLPFALGLAVAYMLVAAVTYRSLPPRPLYAKKGMLYLPRPIRTNSGKVRRIPLVGVLTITPAKFEGLPAMAIVLRDGTSFNILEKEIGLEGRRFLEDVGRRAGNDGNS